MCKEEKCAAEVMHCDCELFAEIWKESHFPKQLKKWHLLGPCINEMKILTPFRFYYISEDISKSQIIYFA